MVRWAPAEGGSDAEPRWSDARPSDDGEAHRRVPADEWRRRRRARRRMSVLLVVLIFLAGSAIAVFGRGGFLDRLDSSAAVAEAENDLLEHARRIRDLRRDINALERDRRSLERIAREELNYVREGEVSFLLLEDDAFVAGTEESP